MRNFFIALAAVLSAFAGIRKSGDHPPSLRPWHYVAAGLTMIAIFIALLLTLVNAIVI